MFHQHHRDSGVRHLSHQLIHLNGFLGVQSGSGFVQKNQARLHRQRAGNFQAFECTVGHAVGTGIDISLQAHKTHQLGSLGVQLAVAPFECWPTQGSFEQVAVQAQVGTHHHVLDGAHVHADLQVLKGARHAPAGQLIRRFAGDGFAIEQNASGGGCVNAGDQVEQRGFTCAVGANHRIHNSCVDGKADVLHRLDTTKVDGQVFDF